MMQKMRPYIAIVALLLASLWGERLKAQGIGVDEITTEITSSGGEIQQGEFGEMFSTVGQPLAQDSTMLDSDGGEASWTGFWHIVPSDTTSGVHEEWAAAGVGASMITSAAPNPFSEEITIYARIEEPAEVRISVFSILGEEIIRLIDGRRETGTSRVRWSPVDLPGGVYLIRLEVDGTPSPSMTVTYAP